MFSFTIPHTSGSATAASFDEDAKAALDAFFGADPSNDPDAITQRDAAGRAVKAAKAMVDSGSLADHFRLSITGHANATPGAPPGGWSQDYLSITGNAYGSAQVAPPAPDTAPTHFDGVESSVDKPGASTQTGPDGQAASDAPPATPAAIAHAESLKIPIEQIQPLPGEEKVTKAAVEAHAEGSPPTS